MKSKQLGKWICGLFLICEFLIVSDGAEEGVSRKRARAPSNPLLPREPSQRLDYPRPKPRPRPQQEKEDERESEENEDVQPVPNIPSTFLSPSVLEYLELGKSIPGRPGTDYPILGEVPYTNFYCDEQPYPGFFADPETRCQGWHYCDIDGRQATFLCPNGTQFSQLVFVCDWWFNVRCDLSEKLYFLNDRLYRRPKFDPAKQHRFITKDLLENIFSKKKK